MLLKTDVIATVANAGEEIFEKIYVAFIYCLLISHKIFLNEIRIFAVSVFFLKNPKALGRCVTRIDC